MKKTTFFFIFLLLYPLTFSFAQKCDVDKLKPLSYGERGIAVKNLQICLIELGYKIPNGSTGFYGSQTRTALRKFYKDVNIEWHGYSFGPKGIEEIKKKLGKKDIATSKKQDLLQQILSLLALKIAQQKMAQKFPQFEMFAPQFQRATSTNLEISLSELPISYVLTNSSNLEVLKAKIENKSNEPIKIEEIDVITVFQEPQAIKYIKSIKLNEVSKNLDLFKNIGVATFSNLNIQISPNQSTIISLKADIPSFEEVKEKTGKFIIFTLSKIKYKLLNSGKTEETAGISGYGKYVYKSRLEFKLTPIVQKLTKSENLKIAQIEFNVLSNEENKKANLESMILTLKGEALPRVGTEFRAFFYENENLLSTIKAKVEETKGNIFANLKFDNFKKELVNSKILTLKIDSTNFNVSKPLVLLIEKPDNIQWNDDISETIGLDTLGEFYQIKF